MERAISRQALNLGSSTYFYRPIKSWPEQNHRAPPPPPHAVATILSSDELASVNHPALAVGADASLPGAAPPPVEGGRGREVRRRLSLRLGGRGG